jgi:hypothetical protein
MIGKASTTGWKRTAMAVMLAYVLALQALLLSMSGAVQAAEGHSPQGVLCITDPGAAPDHQDPAKAHDGPCCILGCHSAGHGGGLPPTSASVERPSPLVVAAAAVPEAPALRVSSNVLPVGSRAPPRLG